MGKLDILISALLPLRCAVCGEPSGPQGLCVRCRELRRPAPSLDVPNGLNECLAVYAYESVVAHEVLAMKATGRTATISSMAAKMIEILAPSLRGVDRPLITWAPTSTQRRRQRGFDQAEELARAIGRQAGASVVSVLQRVSTSAQQGANRLDRSDVGFRSWNLFPDGEWPVVVVVDDVRTTGATLGAAARAIRDSGAKEIIGIAYAATPIWR